MIGRGEATPIYYHGETAETVAAQARVGRPRSMAGVGPRRRCCDSCRAGRRATRWMRRLWDLGAAQHGVPAWRSGRPGRARAADDRLHPLARHARGDGGGARARRRRAIRCSSSSWRARAIATRVAAVRRGAPDARLIVDANEAWTGRDVVAEAAALLPFGVELIEQPVRAGRGPSARRASTSPIPLCADESCQDRADLARCIGRYAAINIKLDKAGGLTEALALADAARAAGLEIMVGCMLSTSLGIAPAFLLAAQARWVDLDGPLLLARDRPGGFGFDGGTMTPPPPGFWG